MKRINHSVLVPYGAREMYDLVDQVERYPQFLPWCGGAQVLDGREPGRIARIDIDYHGIRAHFTTSNANVTGESIVITLVDGPFRHLHGEWRFRPLAEAASKVELELAYEFASGLLERAVGPVFDHIASTFVGAFVTRAESVYGPR
ncbi:MAG: type II toxin-antitoxin system RatA family toxin [Betaproteobacteria bacterium]|jgi:ribosome-associated toxin RatA of RatAB toxin-antitoxin module|nr:type II toxin-antitoxin system RatA family toxin [Betaproteobacteria bacterium]